MTLPFRQARLQSLAWSMILWVTLHATGFAGAQLSNTLQPQTSASARSTVLDGIVLNATTNQPVYRALVQAGSSTVLTEHDGKFQFNASAGTSEMLRVTKPGFYGGQDQGSSAKRVTFGATADPVKIYLFPEGLITGTLTAPNGDPVSGVYVQALRKTGDETGSAWMVAGQGSSNADGQFRLALGAGDYVVETHYMADQFARQHAMMPTMAPDSGSGSESAQSTIHLESGAEQHLDLRPQLLPTHEVHIRIDGTTQSFPQLEAYLSNGLSFFPALRQSGTPGEFIATMPTGSYVLTLNGGDRDTGSYARSAVNVEDSDTVAVIMHVTRSLPIFVDLTIDSSASATSDNTPVSIQQLGLHFVRTTQGAPQMNAHNIYLRAGRNEAANFTLLPGTYRLLAQPLSNWFIASATIAGTDLLAHDLDVEAGETSAPLRIVVSNHTAGIKGTVKLDGSPAGSSWVYLVATTPGVTPIISIAASPDGSFSRPSLPPGSYRAVAFETGRSEDFSDVATLSRLTPYLKSFTVAAGETAALDIDAVPTVESNH